MTGRYTTPCGHWITTTEQCGATPTRHYLPGHRCQAHTPAALAGQPEPPKGPGWKRTPAQPAPMSAGYKAVDARAIASGKRRSNPRAYAAARSEVETQRERERNARKGK